MLWYLPFFKKLTHEYLRCLIDGIFLGLALFLLDIIFNRDLSPSVLYAYYTLMTVYSTESTNRRKIAESYLVPHRVILRIILQSIPLGIAVLFMSHGTLLVTILQQLIVILSAILLGVYFASFGKDLSPLTKIIIAILYFAIGINVINLFFAELIG